MCADEDELEVNNDEDELKVNNDEEEFGQRKVKKIQDPKAPTKEEREEYEKTHLPFWSWCKHCIRGRGKQLPHHEGAQETLMSEVHMDYGFLGKEDEAMKTVPMLVVKERTSKMLMAATVPKKDNRQLHPEEGYWVLKRGRVLARRPNSEVGSGASDQGGGRGRWQSEDGRRQRQVHSRELARRCQPEQRDGRARDTIGGGAGEGATERGAGEVGPDAVD